MPPTFCQRQALLFYVESEPRGTSPVPNIASMIFTPWKYAICPDRDEPSDWRTYVLTTRPPRLSMYNIICNNIAGSCNVYDTVSGAVPACEAAWVMGPPRLNRCAERPAYLCRQSHSSFVIYSFVYASLHSRCFV